MVPQKSLNPVDVGSAVDGGSGIGIGILTGPTATGKTSLALELAQAHGNIEIINADSMLVYRRLDIGTAKPSPEELRQVPHHLIDIRNPEEPFTSGQFKRAAEAAIADIHERGKRALIVGGSGFYLKSLLFGLWDVPPASPELRTLFDSKTNEELFRRLTEVDPTYATRVGPSDRYRLIRGLEIFELTQKRPSEIDSSHPKEPDPRFRLWVLDRPPSELHDRIEKRTEKMLSADESGGASGRTSDGESVGGLIAEFRRVYADAPECRALKAIGYAQVHQYLENRTPPGRKLKPGLAGLSEEIQLATRQLVKQQRTWYRNQCVKFENSKWFILDQDRPVLEEEWKKVYSATMRSQGRT